MGTEERRTRLRGRIGEERKRKRKPPALPWFPRALHLPEPLLWHPICYVPPMPLSSFAKDFHHQDHEMVNIGGKVLECARMTKVNDGQWHRCHGAARATTNSSLDNEFFFVTNSPCQEWVICTPTAFLGCDSRFACSLSGIETRFPVARCKHGRQLTDCQQLIGQIPERPVTRCEGRCDRPVSYLESPKRSALPLVAPPRTQPRQRRGNKTWTGGQKNAHMSQSNM